ncbi:MAG: hypothetical protein M1274_15490 [Actinobacteria bacterium]|nr:hypothetical protein [Actinomycetota bacterium]
MSSLEQQPFEQWEKEVLPILRAVRRMEEEFGDKLLLVEGDLEQLALESALPIERVKFQLVRLTNTGYLGGEPYRGGDGIFGFKGLFVSRDGLEAIKVWPGARPDPDLLLGVLDRAIEAASSSDERTKLEKLRDAVVGLGRETFVYVMGELAKQAAGQGLP